MALVMEIDAGVLSAKFDALLPHLDERQRRLVLAAEARWLGHGGIELVARASGTSRKTVAAGGGGAGGGGGGAARGGPPARGGGERAGHAGTRPPAGAGGRAGGAPPGGGR